MLLDPTSISPEKSNIPDRNIGMNHEREPIRCWSRMNGWLFDTLSSAAEKFLQRAGDKKEVPPSKLVDNETWASGV